MVKNALFATLLFVFIGSIGAQDTTRLGDDSVYLTPPAIKDSFDYTALIMSSGGLGFGPAAPVGNNCSLLGDIYNVNRPTQIYGIAVALKEIYYYIFPNPERCDGWKNGGRDSAYIVFLRVKNRFNNKYYTIGDTLMWHSHGVSRYLEAAEGVCFPMYELYYNSPLPLTVEDTFGVFFRPTYGWELYPSQLTRYGYDSVESSVTYNSLGVPFGSDTPPYDTRVYFATFNGGPDYYSPAHEQFGTIYPILAPPDTDEVPQCMAPANLRMTGQRSGYPFLAWDTTEGGQQEYELQYAPYDSDVWMTRKPTRNPEQVYYPFDPNTYYKARIRSRCYHGCVVHSEWSWSPWSDPILFYIGPTEPDTTSVVADIEALASEVTVAPNPATGHVVVAAPCDIDAVEAFDLQGRMILRSGPKAREVRLDVSLWSPGAYTVYVYVHGRKVVRRVTVQ